MDKENPQWDGDVVLIHYGEENEIAIEPEFEVANHYMGRYLRALPDGGCLIGYLSHDPDCQNPIESCDQMGKIINCSEHRYITPEAQEGFAELGLDADGNVDLYEGVNGVADDSLLNLAARELFPGKPDGGDRADDNDRVCARAVELYSIKRAEGLIGNPLAVALRYGDYGSSGMQVSVAPDSEQFSTKAPTGVWIPESDDCAKAIREMALDRSAKVCSLKIVRVLRAATRGAAVLARYWLSDGTEQTRYESPDATPPLLPAVAQAACLSLRHYELMVAREWASQACEEFEKWANDDCWGICIERYDKDGERIDDDCHHCWGFVGDEYAQEELQQEFDSYHDLFSKPKLMNETPDPSLPLAA